MTIFKSWKKFNIIVDKWLTAPVTNAAGRLCLFRILYSLFYLWYLSANYAAVLGDYPDTYRSIFLIKIFHGTIPPWFFEFIECVLAGTLIILLIGFRVRMTTAIVLALGLLLEAFYNQFDMETATVFLVFYIPLFMLLSNCWGDTYSLDAILVERKTGVRVKTSNSSGIYYMASRCMLVILSILFFGSAISKVIDGGTWLHDSRYIANLVLIKNVKSTIFGLPLNPLAPLIAETPFVYNALRYSVFLTEGMFFFALFHYKLRNLMISLVLIFHSINAIWLTVTFTPVMIVYGLFFDWQVLLRKITRKKFTFFNTVPDSMLIGISLILAVMTSAFWNFESHLRAVFNLGGLINWHTIWYPVFPVMLVYFVTSAFKLCQVTPSRKISYQDIS